MSFVFDNNIRMGTSVNSTENDDFFSDSFTENPNQSDIFMSSAAAGAPIVTPSKRRKTRRAVATDNSEIEFESHSRKARATKGPKVNYVKSMKKESRRSIKTPFVWTWSKFGWMICVGLCIRLVFMDQGVIDFYSMEQTLDQREHSLELLRIENAQIITEIHKIKTSPMYQRKIAREHLGVIAKDEFLVLFANDSVGSSYR